MVDFLFVTGEEGEIDPEKEETNTLMKDGQSELQSSSAHVD